MSGLLYKMCWNFAIPGPCICSSFYSIIKPTYFIKWILFIWSGLAWHCTSSELHYSMAWPGMASSDRPTKTRTHQLSDTTTHTHTTSNGGPLAVLKHVTFSIFSLPAHVCDCCHTSPQLYPSGLFAPAASNASTSSSSYRRSPYSCSTKLLS